MALLHASSSTRSLQLSSWPLQRSRLGMQAPAPPTLVSPACPVSGAPAAGAPASADEPAATTPESPAAALPPFVLPPLGRAPAVPAETDAPCPPAPAWALPPCAAASPPLVCAPVAVPAPFASPP